MKIKNVYGETYRWEKPRVVTSGRGGGNTKYIYNWLSLAYLETDEGITGVGASMAPFEVDSIKDLLLGEDPLCIEKIYHKLTTSRLAASNIVALSAIDIALWDLKAKVAGMPLYKLLGSVREKLECYIAGGYYAPDKTIRDLQEEMEMYLKWGARAVKMKVGGLSAKDDAQRVHAVRQVIGPDVKLLVDANCGWNYSEALEFAKRTEEDLLYWFEEPLSALDLEGFSRLAQHTTTPLAAGESLQGLDQQALLMDTGAVSFIQPDACLCGGVSLVMKAGNYAQGKHIQIAPHGLQQVHVHLNCALPNAAITEFYSPTFDKLAYDAYEAPVRINADGTVSPPEKPGASFDINRKVLEPYRIR